jgi:glycosyltransferase involved in cell wall biosynthesis
MLRARLPELLVPSGDLATFADAVCKIIELDLAAYQNLSQRCAEVAAQFSWAAIAEETLSAYRTLLPNRSPHNVAIS